MSKITRIAVLAISLVSLFGVLASSASALTWTNTGQVNFTATAGNGTLSSGGVNLTCPGATATGSAPNPSAGPVIATGAVTFSTCRLAGQAAHVSCSFSLTASSISGMVTTGNADVTCGVTQLGVKTCHIEGSTPGTYTNGARGVLALSTARSLTVTGPNCRLGNSVPGHLAPLNFTMTSGTGPVIEMD